MKKYLRYIFYASYNKMIKKLKWKNVCWWNFYIHIFYVLRVKKDTKKNFILLVIFWCFAIWLHFIQRFLLVILPWKQWLTHSFKWNFTYKVLDARLVSSCFNWPSSARPHLSLLLANKGVNENTLDNVKPGCTWHPSL